MWIKMTKEKVIPEHKDILGRPLEVGKCVAYAAGNSLYVATVVKLNPKMVKVKKAGTKYNAEYNKYPKDLVVLEGADVTFYLLTKRQ